MNDEIFCNIVLHVYLQHDGHAMLVLTNSDKKKIDFLNTGMLISNSPELKTRINFSNRNYFVDYLSVNF